MGTLELLIILVTFAVLLVEVAQKLHIPYPIVLIAGGALVSFIPGTREIAFDPNIILLLILPPILYYTAFWISNRDFKKNLREIISLALGLVIVTTIAVACAFKWFFPDLGWPVAFLFGALISPPDATAAKAILKRFNLPPRLSNILEGESLINDSTGIVLYKLALFALASGEFSVLKLGDDFFRNVIGGVGIGIALGFGMQMLSRKFLSAVVGAVFSFTIPYVTYILADRLDVSGVLAVVVNGLIGSHIVVTQGVSKRRVLAFAAWDIFFIFLNCVVFVLIGIQLHQIVEQMSWRDLLNYSIYSVIITAVMIIVRFAWIFAYKWLNCKKSVFKGSMAYKEGVLMGWSNMRGIVSLALALALPYTLPDDARNIILFLTFVIILLTLGLTGIILPAIIRRLKIPQYERESKYLSGVRKKLREFADQEIDKMDINGDHKKFLNSYFFTHHAIMEFSKEKTNLEVEKARLLILEAQKHYLISLWKNEELEDHELVLLQQELDLEITHIARGEID